VSERRRFRRFALVAAACLTLAGPAACGGDDEPEEGSSGLPDEPTKQEYIAAADEICQQLYEQRDPLEDRAALAAQTGDLDAAVETFENAAAITENRFDELAELPRPEGDEDLLGSIYERGTRSADLARDAVTALSEGDDRAFAEASQEGARNSSSLNKAAVEYGFLVCGRGQAAEIG
jgi:hypothetical protein